MAMVPALMEQEFVYGSVYDPMFRFNSYSFYVIFLSTGANHIPKINVR